MTLYTAECYKCVTSIKQTSNKMQFRDTEKHCEKSRKTITCPADNGKSKRDEYEL